MVKRNNKKFFYFLYLLATLICISTTSFAENSIRATNGIDKPLPNYTPKLLKSLDVYASRGETVGFFLFLKSDSSKKLTATRFVNQRGRKNGKIKISFFDPQPIKVDNTNKSFEDAYSGIYYDPLLPYPNSIDINASKKGKWVFVDVEVPSDVSAGEYNAKIKFGKKALPIKLKVWKMIIPETPTLPLYGEINPIAVDEGHYGQWRPMSEVDIDLYKKYIKEIRDHRMYPMRSWPFESLFTPFEAGGENRSLDLNSTGFYSSMMDGLSKGLKYDFPDMNCHGSPELAPACNVSNLNKDSRRISYFNAMEQTVKDYSNRGLVATAFLWDEPFMNAWMWKTWNDYSRDINPVKNYYSRVKELVPNVKTVITAPCFTDLAGSVDIFISAPNYMEEGYGNFGGRFGDCAEVQNRGAESWWYVSCMSHGCSVWDTDNNNDEPGTSDFVIERPSSYISSIAWLQAKYKFTAFFYYALVHMYESYPINAGGIDPWTSVYAHTGQGDGTLLYPGRAGERGLKVHQPISSVRLKLWRETSFNAEYINWMEKLNNKPSWWNNTFDSMVTSYNRWSKDYQNYFKMKKKMGAYLTNKKL